LCTVTITSNADTFTWTVPSGTTFINATVIGGGGGAGNYNNNEHAPGGTGAKLTETITVSAGDTLYFYVGGRGADAVLSAASAAGTNTAGSSGGTGNFSGSGSGGGGGGASEIRKNGFQLSNRIVVAGGGGGGGSGCGATIAADQNKDQGGSASGNVGGTGLCTGYAASNGGSGGTLTADGNGTQFRSGRVATSYGGGGGGGYFGGGAGYQGGGGAGSSWIDAATVSGSFATNSSIAAGSITFSYSYQAPTISSLNLNNNTFITYHVKANLVATLTSDGYVTFLANGKRIPNCIKVTSVSLNATCAFQSSLHGSVTITALLYSSRSDASAVATLTKSTVSNSRSNTR
jgi:hypothetical protein